MAQVSLYLRCGEWFYGLTQPRTLTYASQGRSCQPVVKFRRSHQDDIGTGCIAGIGGRQCFQFNHRIGSDSLGIFHDDGDLCAAGGSFGQETPECRKSLHGALGLATDAKARKQQLQHLVRCQRHAANPGDHTARRNRLQCAGNDRRLADSDGSGNGHDRVDGSESFVQAFHDLSLLRTNEYSRTFSLRAE